MVVTESKDGGRQSWGEPPSFLLAQRASRLDWRTRRHTDPQTQTTCRRHLI